MAAMPPQAVADSWRKAVPVILVVGFMGLMFSGSPQLKKLGTRPENVDLAVNNYSLLEIVPLEVLLKMNYTPFKPSVDNWKFHEEEAGWPHIDKKHYANKTCRSVEAGHATSQYPEVLPKTVFSNKTRLVFVMGLEGSGHHMFPKLLTMCPRCRCVREWSQARNLNFMPSRDLSHGGIWGGEATTEQITYELDLFFKEMGLLQMKYGAESTEGKHMPTTFFINTYCWQQVGMLSYPNGMGPCHRVQYPDVRILAELLEYAGIDFRVLVLYRDPLDILLSTVTHRKFAPWDSNAEEFTNITAHAILDQQLLRMDRRYFSCLDYNDLPNIDESVSDLLNVDFEQYNFAEAVKKNYLGPDPEKRLSERVTVLADKQKADHYNRMKTATERMRRFCGL